MKKVKCPVCGKPALEMKNKKKGTVKYMHGEVKSSGAGFGMFMVDSECDPKGPERLAKYFPLS